MDKSVFSKEWLENFKIVFEEEADNILDNVGKDFVFLMDILYGKFGQLGSLLSLESVNHQIENGEYKKIAENYHKSLLIDGLMKEVITIGKDPRRGL